MQTTIQRDHSAFLARLLKAGGTAAYERRNADPLATSIGKIADAFEGHKQTIAELREQVERMETRASRPGAFTGTAPASEEGRAAPPTPAERSAFSQMLRTGDRSLAPEARASINASTSNQGLEAVAPWFDEVVRRMAREMAPLLSIVGLAKANNFPAKHIIGDPSAMGSGWVGDLGTRNETDPPVPRVVEVAGGEWYAIPTISEWALTDLAFDVERWLRQELVEEYAETLDAAIASGNGTNKPTGFLAGPTPVTTADGTRAFGTLRYHATGQAAALPATTSGMIDFLLDIVHGLRWRHRQSASWVMSSVTMSTLRKFKDADNRPILLDSMISGQPTKLMGFPVVECEAMPAIAANSFPIAFGDFKAGYILDEDAVAMRITRDDVTTKGFVKYYARRRVGGKILDSDAIRLAKVAAS